MLTISIKAQLNDKRFNTDTVDHSDGILYDEVLSHHNLDFYTDSDVATDKKIDYYDPKDQSIVTVTYKKNSVNYSDVLLISVGKLKVIWSTIQTKNI